ncbi:glycosyltransferase family 39 protein [Rhodopila sp.]|uniref:glycosyltransferase family 39 protein n=1 Tax=Rhodopila sp. TaxID=2480087 RepID=UPI002B9138A3|nr:glycosyltransferase family 39 protein [Rhodopila sp.]HVZ08205.1 glycosyltransferase family 39 protein [Rhodopila sp.]
MGVAAIMAAATLIRLAVAAVVPLSADEAYYWVWSRALAGGYFDHPPMVALWIRTGTGLIGATPLGVRLLGPLAAAVASTLLYDAGRCLFPGTRAGLIATSLLNATLVVGVGSIIMTPDSPLLVFWTATLWTMARLLATGRGIWWLAAGVLAGLASLSKYTALFLWVGIGLWALLVPAGRAWLRRWQPWVGIAIGAAMFAPVVAWNAAHQWAGFLKQGGRVTDWQPGRAVGFLAELVGSQAGLVTPWIFILCLIGLAAALRRMRRAANWALLAALSLPPVLVFLQHALGDRVQGNWPAVIYPALSLAAAGWLTARGRRDWVGASALGFAITAAVYLQAVFGLVPLPPRLDPIAMRLRGWDVLARDAAVEAAAMRASFVAADGYDTDSQLAWTLSATVPMVGVDPRWVLFDLRRTDIAGRIGLLLRDARRAGPPDPALWNRAEKLGEIDRPGAPAPFTAWRVVAAPSLAAVPLLPRRH